MKVRKCERKKCGKTGGEFSRINSKGKMFCMSCYRRIKKYGYFKRVSSDPNIFIKKKNYYIIRLWNKQGGEKGKTIIDLEDYNKVKKMKWCIDGRGYVHSKSNGKAIKLHQFILGKKNGFVIDHINRNKLDNRKLNLRHITQQENTCNNTSKGYYFEKRRKKYIVRISRKGICYGGKGYATEKEAKKAVEELRKKYK